MRKKKYFVPKMEMNHSQILKHVGTDGQTDIQSLHVLKKGFIIRIGYIYKYIYAILIMGRM